MKPIEEVAQRVELVVGEALAEERADARDVIRRCRPELLAPRVGQFRVDDARVTVAGGLLDETGALQPVEQARDSRRREQHLLCQVDPPHHAIGCSGQAEQHLVVVDRQAVVGDELAVQPANDGRVGSDEADERLDLHAFRGNLRTHTTNCNPILGG